MDFVTNFFQELMFNIIKGLGDIINVIVRFMRMLLGLDAVKSGSSGTSSNANLVLDAITEDVVMYAFLAIVGVAFVATLLFAVIRVIRNALNDEKDDGALSKHKAVKEIVLSFMTMLVVPFFCIALVMAVTAVAQSLDIATSSIGQTSYSTEIIFSVVDKSILEGVAEKYHQVPDSNYQLYIYQVQANGTTQVLTKVSGMEAVKAYWSGTAYDAYGNAVTCAQNWDTFCAIFDEDAYMANFLLPLLGSCVMFFALGMAAIIVSQRLFYVVLLFISSPLIVSVRPLDDGARWRKWQEMFLSKLMGSFAIIIALNIFFLLSSWLTTDLRFFDNEFSNAIAKLFIYIAGVIAATGSPQLVAQLIGSDAGTQERDQAMNNFRTMMGGAQLAKGTTKAATSLAKKATGGVSNFLAGKKTSPLTGGGAGNVATMGATGGGAGASERGMAQKIGDLMQGKTSVGDAAKSVGNSVKNSRFMRGLKGAGALALGVAVLPYRLVKKGVDGVADVSRKIGNKIAEQKDKGKVGRLTDKKSKLPLSGAKRLGEKHIFTPKKK